MMSGARIAFLAEIKLGFYWEAIRKKKRGISP